MPKQVFISYSSEDKHSADEICRLLEELGLDCWIAPRDVTPGKSFGEEIVSAIEDSALMVLILSGSANISAFVMREVERAIANRKLVIPFRIQDVKPAKALELFIASSQWIDAWIPPLEAKVQVLASVVRGLLGLPMPALPLPVPAEVPGPVEESPPRAVPQENSLPDITSSAEVRARVDRALEDLVVQSHSGRLGGSIEDKNSLPVWRQLYADCRGAAIVELCNILEEPQRDSNVQWKAIRLLGYGLRTPEGRSQVPRILAVLHDHLAAIGAVGEAALRTMCEAPIPPREKWNYLLACLETAHEQVAGKIVGQLPQFTPPADRARTGAVILDLLTFATDHSAIISFVSALGRLDYRQGIPAVREMLVMASVDKAVQMARVLSEWNDQEAIPIIRQVIENWRYGSDATYCELLVSLYRLQGSACASYIGEVLLGALPEVQRHLLGSTLKYSLGGGARELAVLNAAKELSRTSDRPDLRKLADDFVGNA